MNDQSVVATNDDVVASNPFGPLFAFVCVVTHKTIDGKSIGHN
jgi:hypothetical protein